MLPRLINAKPVKPLKIELLFDNGEKRIFDASPYCNSYFFSELKDWNYFENFKIKNGTVEWQNEQDFAPETIYLDSKPMS
jgi:hypothetical protein